MLRRESLPFSISPAFVFTFLVKQEVWLEKREVLRGVDIHLGTGGAVKLIEAKGELDRQHLLAEVLKIGSSSCDRSQRSDILMEVSRSSLDSGGENV